MNARCLILLPAVWCLSGCVIGTTPTGPLQHDTRSIPRDASELASVNVRMGAGELRMNGGSPDLLRAEFSYNVPSWKPDVRYSSDAGRANLTIEQPGTQASLGSAKNEWDLRLNNEIPMDVIVHFGAGEARLNLGSLSLRSVEMEIGAGELDVDLRGNPRRDYDVRVRGGAGEATVHVPGNVGIYAKAEGGIGEIQVRGLRREGQHWINDAYGSSKVQIHLDIRGGVGQINLFAE
jgi:hypothetical protein